MDPELRALLIKLGDLDPDQTAFVISLLEDSAFRDRAQELVNADAGSTTDAFNSLAPQAQADLVDPATRQKLNIMEELAIAGKTANTSLEDNLEVVKSVLSDPATRSLVHRVATMSPETRQALSQAAEHGDLDQWETDADLAGRLADAEQSLRGISEKLVANAEAEAQLVSGLREQLGSIVNAVDGQILDDGSIVLPENVVFEQGRSTIRPELRDFLDEACLPWLNMLQTSGLAIESVEIQGHASREWRGGTPADIAYENNLVLSQERARNVLSYCLGQVRGTDAADWARGHVVSVGYSSARPVEENGVVSDEKSRRVVFAINLDREQLLEDIETDTTQSFDKNLATGE